MDNHDVHTTARSRKPSLRKEVILVTCSFLLILCAALAFVSMDRIQGVHAASSSFSQGASSTSASQAQLWFQPSGWTAGYVITHYTVASGVQQNVNMTYNSSTSRWEYTIGGLSAGNVISYSFTYQLSGLQYDTGSYSYTFGSTAAPTPTPTTGGSGGVTPTPTPTTGGTTNGTFPLTLQNNTGGKWTNSQIYIMVLGQATPGQWSYLQSNGTLVHINHLDANASNHLTKNGVNYANMAFTLAQASTVTIPTVISGARMYISLGSPMYIPIASDDSGWGGPNIATASDPNADVYFDWYEFTYQYGVTAFGGNTTQVDMFGFPMTARLQQTSSGYDQTVGITLTRSQIYSQYATAVGSAFTGLSSTYRILAPKSSPTFATGGSQANYMQAYIAQTWSYYTTNAFNLTSGGATFAGKVVNGQLQFTDNGSGSFVLNEPTSSDVLACSGALASGGTQELQLEAAFCAAFNRGVALNTATWNTPSTYYTNSVHNDYAMFWHQISINNKAYGFPYDDVNNQSSVTILPNANPPSNLTIGIGW
jgi:hypothetical protein